MMNTLSTTPYQEINKNACFVIIGEAPAANEITHSCPFVGQSGALLERILYSKRIPRSSLSFLNVCRSRIPDASALIRPNGSSWTDFGQEEYSLFLPRLQFALSQSLSKVVVALGNVPLKALTGKWGISKWRGSVLPLMTEGDDECLDYKVIPTYHPAFILRGAMLEQFDMEKDIERAIKETKREGFPSIGGDIISNPSFEQAYDWLEECSDEAPLVSHDIETANGQISAMSFAMTLGETRTALCVPLRDITRGDWCRWTEEEEMALWKLIREIFSEPMRTIVGQNYIYDLSFMRDIAGRDLDVKCIIEDTMVLHSLLLPDRPKGLDYLCSLYTDIPYYKDEGQIWKLTKATERDQLTFWEYAAKDALATYIVWEELEAILLRKPSYNWIYRRTMDLMRPLIDMQLKGIKVNVNERDSELGVVEKEQKDILSELIEITKNPEFNPMSSKQVEELLYDIKKLRPYVLHGKRTTRAEALRRLIVRDNSQEALLIQKYRGWNKYKNALEMRLTSMNRLRGAVNLRGTRFGRISINETVDGYGGNMQNLEMRYKRVLVPDEGYMLVEFDGAGAEWLVVAYLTDDPRMISVAQGYDSPHTVSAVSLFNAERDLIVQEDKLLGHTTNPETLLEMRKEFIPEIFSLPFVPVNMTLRQAAKKANHGMNYDLGYKTFARLNDMTESDAKVIHRLYRNIYNIENYHRIVRETLSRNDKTLINHLGRPYKFIEPWGHALFLRAYAFIPQSTVVDIINQGLLRVWRDSTLYQWQLLMQVHDSVLYQVPIPKTETDLKDFHSDISQIKKHLTHPIATHNTTYSIPIDVKLSKRSWANLQEYDPYLDIRDAEM